MLSITILVILITVISQNDIQKVNTKISTTDEAAYNMKGVWVSYITLDMQNSELSKDNFTKKINTIVNKTKESGFNTIVFQVRPFCDALYESSYFPWSHTLTGTQGKNPNFDPLEIMCKICHENNIKIHAWINPYRVKSENYPEKLSTENPYYIDNSLGFEYNNAIYLDPSNEGVQNLITNGVKEIVQKYDVDGIQFDDYFYPENCKNIDDASYNKYTETTENPLSKDEWRLENVNNLIKKVYKTVHKYSNTVEFGISPQGNIENNYAIGADVKTWCKESGYIDYICPQIYYSLDNPSLNFEECLSRWKKTIKNQKLRMYVGIAGYKGGTDEDEGTWLDNNDILKTQIEICEENDIDGIMLYSYESFFDEENKTEIENVVQYLTGITED